MRRSELTRADPNPIGLVRLQEGAVWPERRRYSGEDRVRYRENVAGDGPSTLELWAAARVKGRVFLQGF